MIKPGQIVEAYGVVGVVLSQNLFLDRQRLFGQRQGPSVVALVFAELGQIVEAQGVVGVVLAKYLFLDRQRLFVQRQRRAKSPWA